MHGLQSAGIQATLKHFAGYSASRAARNMAPVAIGRREFADVILVPFEMALRGGARSVMPSYTDIDGVPVSGDRGLLTTLLRDELGFDGLVVSDYYAIAFLQTQHAVAATPAQAAALALEAGLDVELPTVACYGAALVSAVRDGRVPAGLVDRAAARVLRQKCDLGLLDPDWPGLAPADGAATDLDPPGHRALARRLAEAVLDELGERRFRGAELALHRGHVAVPGLVAQPEAGQLRGLLLQGHPAEQVRDPLRGRPRRVPPELRVLVNRRVAHRACPSPRKVPADSGVNGTASPSPSVRNSFGNGIATYPVTLAVMCPALCGGTN